MGQTGTSGDGDPTTIYWE